MVSCAIVNPPIYRHKAIEEVRDVFIHVEKETDAGLVISGAKVVATGSALTANNRIIAFDMPWHGKSLPPVGYETQEYLLSTQGYIETILAFCAALGLARPVLAGCSMGGRIALQLAALHPEHFCGFIAIEASDFQPAWYDIDWFHRPDAHGGEMGAALVSANISPHAPNEKRWNTQWIFMQSGPGVFRGDLRFGVSY